MWVGGWVNGGASRGGAFRGNFDVLDDDDGWLFLEFFESTEQGNVLLKRLTFSTDGIPLLLMGAVITLTNKKRILSMLNLEMHDFFELHMSPGSSTFLSSKNIFRCSCASF